MKKVIVKVNLHDEKIKQKGMKAVSGLQGVESISMDMKDQKLTVIGDVDPVVVVNKIRKLCPADIVSVGPAKEEKKKEEPKKEEPKKDDQKKKEEELLKAIQACQAYTYPYMASQQYFVKSAEEDPNACVIC